MTKQELLNLCDQVFKKYGFSKKGKKGKSYYLDLGSDILGSIHIQYSDYGGAIYLNCGFSMKNYNDHLPYPKNEQETNMCWRIAVPGKEKLANKPENYEYLTEMIKYERYDQNELEDCIEKAFNTWVIPAIQYGMEYILAHDEYYHRMVKIAKMLHGIPE